VSMPPSSSLSLAIRSNKAKRYVCMNVCMHMYLCIYVYICMYVCMCISMRTFNVCMFVLHIM